MENKSYICTDMEIQDLKRVKTYADEIKKSVTWVYKLAKNGDVKLVEIDGVKFIKK